MGFVTQLSYLEGPTLQESAFQEPVWPTDMSHERFIGERMVGSTSNIEVAVYP